MMKLQLLFSAIYVLFIPTWFCAVAQTTSAMTYNIRNSNARDGVNHWSKRKEAFVEVIRKTNPDILGMQEVLKDQLTYLKRVMPDYQTHGVGRNDGKSAGEHSPVFFKKERYEKLDGGNFWLSETPQIPGSKSWDAAITRM